MVSSCCNNHHFWRKVDSQQLLHALKPEVVRILLLRKSARRWACAIGRAWRCFRYKDIDHRLKCEHECALLRLPREMALWLSFLSLLDLLNWQLTMAHFMRGKNGIWLTKKESEGPIHVCAKEQMARLSV
jgi:hypothetical protein